MSGHNIASNAFNALTQSTGFIQQQRDRERGLQQQQTQANIAGLLTPNNGQVSQGARRMATQQARQSGSANIINSLKSHLEGLDAASQAQGHPGGRTGLDG